MFILWYLFPTIVQSTNCRWSAIWNVLITCTTIIQTVRGFHFFGWTVKNYYRVPPYNPITVSYRFRRRDPLMWGSDSDLVDTLVFYGSTTFTIIIIVGHFLDRHVWDRRVWFVHIDLILYTGSLRSTGSSTCLVLFWWLMRILLFTSSIVRYSNGRRKQRDNAVSVIRWLLICIIIVIIIIVIDFFLLLSLIQQYLWGCYAA